MQNSTPTKRKALQSAAAVSRRQFITRTSLAAGAAAMYFPYVGNVLGANDRINIACIGVTGKGDSDSLDAANLGGNIVALVDVDSNHIDYKLKQFASAFPNLKPQTFKDYREMFDKMEKNIDAVTISTPDHHHGIAAVRALKSGKHTFCQKPLVQTVEEARILRKLAAEKKVATQMGNQGSAESGLRRGVECIQAGVIGVPKELHVWSNRPVWPQGLERPAGEDPVPGTLDWDLWLGPAAMRPFKDKYETEFTATWGGKGVYQPFNWRGWLDFGTGALGDMACHTVNMAFRALKLGFPNKVECEATSKLFAETYPKSSRIRFEFPERDGLPPLKFWWYDGNPKDTSVTPFRPSGDTIKEILALDNLPTSGSLIIGTKGKIFSPDDYGTQFYICPTGNETFESGDKNDACKAVPITIPRLSKPKVLIDDPRINGGTTMHMSEWFAAMKGGPAAYSNFDIAAYLTEIILLGCVALRTGVGKAIDWDGPNMKSTNMHEADQFVRRVRRPGWEIA